VITSRQRKGIVFGIIWSFIAWVPYYTEYLSSIRNVIGFPAALGLNLELALMWGDAFIYSIFLGAGIGFFAASIVDFFSTSVKIIGLSSLKKKRLVKRGL